MTKNNETEYKTIEMTVLNPEYSKLVYPLSKLEYEVAKNSINQKDLHLPTIINSNNVILESHNRYSICKEFKIEPRFEVKNFEDLLDENGFNTERKLKKRQLNDFQKYELIYSLEKLDQVERCKKKFYERRFEKENFKNKDFL